MPSPMFKMAQLAVIVGCIVLVTSIIIASSGQRKGATLQTPKGSAIADWDHVQVMKWLKSHGDWTKQYEEAFEKEGINGKLLVSFDDQNLVDLGVSSAVHRSFILKQVQMINSDDQRGAQHVDPNIKDYWSFRETNRQVVTTLTIGMFASPRLTTLYAYLYEFETIFKPFFGIEDPGFFFWVTWLLFPSCQTASSAFSFFWVHPFLILVLFASSFFEVVSESLMLLRGVPKITGILSTPIFLILAAIMPFLAPVPCDLLLGVFCLTFIPIHVIDAFIRVVNSTFTMF